MEKRPRAGSQLLHKAMAAASGAVGGGFGLAALPVELPISTTSCCGRSETSRAARARTSRTRKAPSPACRCSRSGPRDGKAKAAESGYFTVRGMLAKSVAEAARFIAERGIVAEGAPALVRFIAQIAARFGVVVTQKVAAQAVPVVGALGGAAVNYEFIDHFQEVARAQFIVRRLERRYGKEVVRAEYERLLRDQRRRLSRADNSHRRAVHDVDWKQAGARALQGDRRRAHRSGRSPAMSI